MRVFRLSLAALPLAALFSSPLLAQYRRPDVVSPSVAATKQDNIVTPWAEIPASALDTLVKGHGMPIEYTGVLNVRRGRIELYYFNQAANRQFLVDEYPVPVGATAMRVRPATTEIWVAVPNSRIGYDPATGNVSDGGVIVVVDAISGVPIRTIAAGKNPTGLVFHPSGSHAYVSCKGSRDVHVIDCATGLSIAAVDLDQYTPHAIDYVVATDTVVVAALLSGNRTVARGTFSGDTTPDVVTDTGTDPLIATALPDRDVVVLAVNPANPGSVVRDDNRLAQGNMTIQYALASDPNFDRAFVVGTEALNAQFAGERNFVAGQVVENRLVMLDYSGGGTPARTSVALDGLPFGPMATPTDFVVDPNQKRGWLVARGVDRVVEFDLSNAVPVPVGGWDIRSADPNYQASLVGARNVEVDPSGRQITVWCEIENSFAVIDVTVPAPTTPTAVTTTPLAFDPLPAFAKGGWASLSDANRSASQTSSCASCHVDLGTDNLVWELSKWHDPEGTPQTSLQHEQDNKGPMLTQVLFGLPEAAPFHWRGEQRTLADFNGAFTDLLEGQALNPQELDEMVRFIGLLRYAPNRNQAMDRSYANTAAPSGAGNVAQGLVDFEQFPVYGVANGARCSTCHQLPMGTNNEIQFTVPVGPPSFTVKVAPLRGLVNRLDAPLALGPFAGNRAGNGAGLTHAGQIGSFAEFVSHPVFGGLQGPAAQPQRDNLVAFMEAFDTGLAPGTSFVRVLRTDHATPGPDFDATIAYISAEALAGHADFSATMALANGAGGFDTYFGFWDASLGAFVISTQNAAPLPPPVVKQLFLSSGQPITFVGHPPGSGQRWSIDADDDALLDLDEIYVHTTNPFVADTDGDGRPDGHEVANGERPLTPDPATDMQAPSPMGAVRTQFVTTHTARLELNTDEPAQVRAFVRVSIGTTIISFPLEGQSSPATGGFTTNHQLVLSGLPSAIELPVMPLPVLGQTQLPVDLELLDPAGNRQTITILLSPGQRPAPIRVAQIANAAYVAATNSATFQVQLGSGTTILDLGLPGGPGQIWNAVVRVSYGTRPGASGTQINGLTRLSSGGSFDFIVAIDATTNPGTFTVPLPASAATDSNRVLAITVHDVIPQPGAGFGYIETQGYKSHHAVLSF
ncbi:MAG: hypothetical protein IT457_07695 [Planctomycetes bacterium]|nr:hypothetical protein [Planctomycetota bacterium]